MEMPDKLVIEQLRNEIKGLQYDCAELQKKNDELAEDAVDALSKTLLIFDAFNEVFELSKINKYAEQVIKNWADAKWFTDKQDLEEKIKLTVFKVCIGKITVFKTTIIEFNFI